MRNRIHPVEFFLSLGLIASIAAFAMAVKTGAEAREACQQTRNPALCDLSYMARGHLPSAIAAGNGEGR